MYTTLILLRRYLLLILCACLIAACASNGEAKAPEPGSKKWHAARMQEIETAKAEGKLTEQEYLTLKNEADDMRQEYLSASRSRDYPPVGFGLGFGVVHHHH